MLRHLHRAGACAALAAGLAGGCAAPPEAPVRPPDILLISIDTLRADRLGCYGHPGGLTPALDRLAVDGVVFEQVVSPTPMTLPSHASMLSGLLPFRHGVRTNEGFRLPERVQTLAETLRAAGYRTGAFLGGATLERAGGLGQGFDEYDDRMPLRRFGAGNGPGLARPERYAEEVLDAAARWLAADDTGGPVFAFVHLFDPHKPYETPLPGETAGSYEGEIARADRALGAFLHRLGSDSRWEGMVIAVTSDHGESLGEHGESTHALFVYEATQRVPWILHGVPGVPSGRRARPVGLADVTPTLLEAAGLPVPAGLDGVSALRGEGAATPARDLYVESLLPKLAFGWAPLRGLRRGAWKVIDAPRREIYDLAADPSERVNLIDREGERAGEMMASLTAMAATEAEDAGAGVDPARRARIESLGYLSAPPGAPSGSPPADPKDRVAVYEQFTAAHLEAQHGDPAAAAARFARLEPAFAASPAFLQVWGDVAVRAGDLPQARRCYERSLVLDPTSLPARVNLGVTLMLLGRRAEALVQFEETLARDPDHPRANLHAGLLLHDLGREAEGRARLERFLVLAPDDPLADRVRRLLGGGHPPPEGGGAALSHPERGSSPATPGG